MAAVHPMAPKKGYISRQSKVRVVNVQAMTIAKIRGESRVNWAVVDIQ